MCTHGMLHDAYDEGWDNGACSGAAREKSELSIHKFPWLWYRGPGICSVQKGTLVMKIIKDNWVFENKDAPLILAPPLFSKF